MWVLAPNFNLTQTQRDVLNRGLTFIPTIRPKNTQETQFRYDIQQYHRRLKLALYFKHKHAPARTRRFEPPSHWVPPREKLPPEIPFLIKKDFQDFHTHFALRDERPNFTPKEHWALKELIKNPHIVIKPADKGSSTVILSRLQYIQEAHRQLNDPTYYVKLREPLYLQTAPLVHQIIDQLYKDKWINAKQKNYLKGDSEPRPRRFYILPKIHKDPSKWTIPSQLPPGRPIVSDCSSETYQTAEFIEFYLFPLSTRHPAYIKDTYHFINEVKKLKIPEHSYFFTMDVDSLYTNIDIGEGLQTVAKIFHKYPDNNRPDEALLKLLEINLTRNDFEFNGEFYLQIKGTAMGKRFAPSYANIFMAAWEEDTLNKCHKKPYFYCRYLDDIFGIWTFSEADFLEFLQILDSHNPSIRLKHSLHKEHIDFLDTTVFKGPDFLDTHSLDIKVYFKDTDTHALLFKSSFHPRHTFKGLVKSQLIRFQRICTRKEDFLKAVNILFGTLRNRGYARSLLRECLHTFELKKPTEQTQTEVIPLITTFSTTATKINSLVRTNFHTFIHTQGLLPRHKFISAYRKNLNLKDYLVRAQVTPINTITRTNRLDTILEKLRFIHNTVDHTIFKIQQTFTPHTQNCVYLIFCAQCGKQYVGETKNTLAMRMTQHFYVFRNRKPPITPITAHFLTHGASSVRLAGIKYNTLWSDAERKKEERRWISLLNTKEPYGLNSKY